MRNVKIIQNSIIPFPGFLAINLFGILFVRRPLNAKQLNHELIHTAQMKELGYLRFYFSYLWQWFLGLFKYGSSRKSYYHISYEREAYSNADNLDYLYVREPFNFLNYG